MLVSLAIRICFAVSAFSRRVAAAPPGVTRYAPLIRLAGAFAVPDGGGCHPGERLIRGLLPGGMMMVDGRAVVPGLRLGYSVHVEAG